MSGPTTARRPPTDEQAQALDVSRSSVVLSAGAGCGKTFVLAERFVRALEGPSAIPLGRIVALTFTKKAARELRDRIRAECRVRLEEGHDTARWRSILRGLEAAKISTFHAYCGEILRRHAVEARVDPGFAVLDEAVALSIRETALAGSIRERLAARDPDLIELAVELGLGPVWEALDDLLGNRSVGDIQTWADREPAEVVAGWREVWEREVCPQMISGFLADTAPCRALIAATSTENPKIRTRLDQVADILDRLGPLADDELIVTLGELVSVAIVQGLAAKLWPSAETHKAFKDHFESIRKKAKKLAEVVMVDLPASQVAATQGLMLARLAVHAQEAYDRAKQARGVLDNDDLLALTRQLLTSPEGRAREEVAGSVDLILVDEFQDTDPVQSEILEAIGGPGLLDGKLFLVGDFKQSIYRFRGAKPKLFLDYRERVAMEGRKSLSENFRSVPAILDFANTLFIELLGTPPEPLRPGGNQALADLPPAVEFLWPPVVEGSASAKLDVGNRRREEARRIARHLRARIDEGWTVRDRKAGGVRRADAGDIAFLFRSLTDSSEYEKALVEEGFDFHVVGGSGFYAQQEVLDLVNVLTAIDDPLDAVAMAGALRSPFFSLSDDALYWIATASKGRPHVGLDRCDGPFLDALPEADRPRAVRARTLFEDWRAVKDRLPIASLVERILDDSGYEGALLGESLGDRKRANARKLVRMARSFDEPGGFTLADFVSRLRADLREATKETQAATTDEEGAIVRLMSIHQAKGLEFPIVVIPDLDRKRPPQKGRVAFDPELGPLVNAVVDSEAAEDDGSEAGSGQSLGWTVYRHRERRADDEEALRLFYVATTRARDSLVISSATDPRATATSPARSLLARRFDLETGRCLATLPEGWAAPSIRVIAEEKPGADRPGTASRRRSPRLREVADLIRLEAPEAEMSQVPKHPSPRFIDLDPADEPAVGPARVDRLVRSILADPRSFEPARIADIAARAARLQAPVPNDRVIEEARRRVETWNRARLAGEVARSATVHRAWNWLLRRSLDGESIQVRGRLDFLFVDAKRGLGLVQFGEPDASPLVEEVRWRLSAAAALERSGLPVGRAWRVGRDGEPRPIHFDFSDGTALVRVLAEFLKGLAVALSES
jgi:ATP-dependent helicase/nuclease subunit A